MDTVRNSRNTVSEGSRRIARNTLLLYVRMLVLMFVGLFTSRVVLAALGETDYGVYNAVGGMVTVFTFVTTSISAAISRYLAFEIGRGGDSQRLRKVFSAGIAVQLAFAMILILLAETLGQWFLHSRMNIPLGREGAAEVVLQCSLAALVIQLLSVPYNAAIIAHEKMSAFAVISFLEAGLKLSVALVVKYAMCDKLILYAVLVAAVSLQEAVPGEPGKIPFGACFGKGDARIFGVEFLWFQCVCPEHSGCYCSGECLLRGGSECCPRRGYADREYSQAVCVEFPYGH